MTSRYNTDGNPEGEFEPGSQRRVLQNRLHVTDPVEMDDIELSLLDNLQGRLVDEIEMDQRITAADLCEWHRRWLEEVYAWAGRYRAVNMEKDGFPFAGAHLIPKLMQDYQEKYLRRYTPCEGMGQDELIEALAICHVELILIHPFREGNGRLSRVLATIMALQAGYPPPDFSWLVQNKAAYIVAIHQGLAGNYTPMKSVFGRVLEASQNAGS